MVDVQTEIVIDRAVDAVASYAADPAHAPEWYVNIASMAWRTAPVLQVGAQVDFEARFLGRTLRYTYEVREYVPNERLVMSTSEGPFPMETTYTWTPDPRGGTRMTLRNRGQPSGFSRWLAPFMASMMRRANVADLAALKRILEGHIVAHAGS